MEGRTVRHPSLDTEWRSVQRQAGLLPRNQLGKSVRSWEPQKRIQNPQVGAVMAAINQQKQDFLDGAIAASGRVLIINEFARAGRRQVGL